MAQLPPKIPTITQNWPPFVPHQRMPSSTMANLGPTSANNTFTATAAAQNSQLPSSVDEFLHFSSARRGAHRRSASDSVAFLETTFLDEFRNSGTMMGAGSHGFDRLDDEQLMSMFSDDIVSSVAFPPPPPHSSSLSNPCSPPSSSPSEQNSTNDEKPMALDGGLQDNQRLLQPKNEPGEVDSSCRIEKPAPPFSAAPSGGETIVDHKRVKRILANRQSAQRSRARKLQYISELERSVTTLQSEVSALSPRVAFLDHQRLILNVDNSALKQRIAALAQDKIFKDAHQEALKKEIERLRQIYQQQNLRKMANTVNDNGHSLQAPPHSHPSQPLRCTEEQLLC